MYKSKEFVSTLSCPPTQWTWCNMTLYQKDAFKVKYYILNYILEHQENKPHDNYRILAKDLSLSFERVRHYATDYNLEY